MKLTWRSTYRHVTRHRSGGFLAQAGVAGHEPYERWRLTRAGAWLVALRMQLSLLLGRPVRARGRIVAIRRPVRPGPGAAPGPGPGPE